MGFCLLVAVSAALAGAVLLLPEYARLARARYELARQKAANADLEALIAANEHLIAGLPQDPVLTKRLAMCQLGLWPENEAVVLDTRRPRHMPPGLVCPTPQPRPEPPNGWLMRAAARVSRPATRRGLLLLAAAALVTALALFAPPEAAAGRTRRTGPDRSVRRRLWPRASAPAARR